jgi:uncharacterized delta-60 repeat protein
MKKPTYSLIFILVLFTSFGFGQAGSLDATFGVNGKATTPFQIPMTGYSNSVLLQPDGKIIVVGYSSTATASNRNFTLARYNANGNLDPGFGTNGKVITDLGSDDDLAFGAALQSDGKIVAVGEFNNGSSFDFAMVRYNPNGSLDNSFGTAGKVITSLGAGSDEAFSVAIQPLDGKIVVAGSSFSSITGYDFAVVRYNTTGTKDATFGTNGVATTNIGNDHDAARSVAIQADGRIVTAGSDFTLVRYKPNGNPDPNFGTNGIVRTNMGSGSAYSVAIQQDGKIVAVGAVSNTTDYDFAVLRFNLNGSPDLSFSTDGKVIKDLRGGNDIANSVVQANGKILVAGVADIGLSPGSPRVSVYDFALARYNLDGTPDLTFDSDGIVITAVSSGSDGAHSVAIQANEKIVATGSSPSYNGSVEFTTLRYLSNGSLDNSFNVDGIVTTNFGTSPASDFGNSIAIQQDQKIVVAGVSTGSLSDMAIARYNADGSLDKGFNSEGKALINLQNKNFYGNAVAIQADGKIVVAGKWFNGSNYDFGLARLNVTGTLDNTFNGSGIVTTSIGTGDDVATSIVIQPNGKIIVAGYAYIGSNYDFATVRYNTNGLPDDLFGLHGIVTTDILANRDEAHSVAIQADAKIVVAGFSVNPGSGFYNDFAVVRYKSNGTLDNTFGSGQQGKVTTDVGGKSDYGYSVAIQPLDQKIVVGGYSVITDEDFSLVRYNTNGSLDFSFGSNGKKAVGIGANTLDVGHSVLIQNGLIILSGYSFGQFLTNGNFALMRFTANGLIDNTFGNQGKVSTDFIGNADLGNGMALQQDGKIVVAGVSNNGANNDFALARYLTAGLDRVAGGSNNNVQSFNAVQSFEVSPNPVYQKAKISFSFNIDLDAVIELHDAAGNKIKTIEEGKFSKGVHQIEFFKDNLLPGIYFLQLTADKKQVTKKLTIY